MKEFVFNPLNDKCPKGTCKKKTNVVYNLKVSKFISFEKAFFVIHRDGLCQEYYEMKKVLTDEKYIYLKCNYTFLESGHYWYHFEVKTTDNYYRLVRAENYDCMVSDADVDFLQLVTEKDSCIDKNFRKGIIYHIFVDRFNKKGEVEARQGLHLIDDWNKPIELEYNEKGERCNCNCYGGNLQGVIDKLDYLKSLNVSTIYLSPIFEAHSSHKYNTADYSKVDSMFGTTEILEELLSKAKEKKINIILDGVFNHTGSDSIYFNKYGRYKNLGAYQSKDSPYYSWYDFISFPDLYSSWWGIKSLPQTKDDSGFAEYIAGENGIINKFMKLGLYGFRLDVVDELSNNFLKSICKAVRDVNPKAIMVGEVWEDASSKISYSERKKYFLGEYLDSVTNYPIKNSILDVVKNRKTDLFVNTIRMFQDQYPEEVQHNLMNILDTHDTIRALTALGIQDYSKVDDKGKYVLSLEERKQGIELMKIASLIQYTVLGIPTVFYGDEVGIEGMKDPYCRATYPWGKEEKELLEWYKELGKLRKNTVLHDGKMEIKYAKDGALIYERIKKEHKILVAVNMSNKDLEFILDDEMKNYFSNEKVSGKCCLKPKETMLLVK